MAILRFDLVYLIVGAIAGAYLRYRIGSVSLFIAGIPLSILLINALGSFILGLSMSTIQRFGLSQNYTLLLGVGFCGSFTTMSSFAYQSGDLLYAGKILFGFVDIMLNVGLSILAVFAGRAVAALIFS